MKIFVTGPLTDGFKWARYRCPGCNEIHSIPIDLTHQSGRAWGWNGSVDAPTFSPSVRHTMKPLPYCCHYFVRDGRIEFCGDCSHGLKGQTVDLPILTADPLATDDFEAFRTLGEQL